jgi:hypothetical protein
MMMMIRKYTKLINSPTIPKIKGGVNNKNMISAIGNKENIIQGNLRPHRVCVLSDKYPMKVSFKLFQIDHMINPIEIDTISIPTTAK